MSGDEAVRKEAFQQIMGAIDMPDDTGPDYDEWLFNRAWQAARSAAIQECADRLRAMNHPVYADMILLALKERNAERRGHE